MDSGTDPLTCRAETRCHKTFLFLTVVFSETQNTYAFSFPIFALEWCIQKGKEASAGVILCKTICLLVKLHKQFISDLN